MDRTVLDLLTRGRGLHMAPTIDAAHGLQFLAVDEVDGLAAALGFGLGRNGTANAEGLLAIHADGRWWEDTAGGATYGGWDAPWTRPADGWDGHAVLRLGCSGREVEVDPDVVTEVLVLVHVGFARHDVAAIEVDDVLGSRRVAVTSPSGGWVVISRGEAPIDFRAVADDGRVLESWTYER